MEEEEEEEEKPEQEFTVEVEEWVLSSVSFFIPFPLFSSPLL